MGNEIFDVDIENNCVNVITGVLEGGTQYLEFDLAVAEKIFDYKTRVSRNGYEIQPPDSKEWLPLPRFHNAYGSYGDPTNFMQSHPGYTFYFEVETDTIKVSIMEGIDLARLFFERTSTSVQMAYVLMCYLVFLVIKGVDITPLVSYKLLTREGLY